MRASGRTDCQATAARNMPPWKPVAGARRTLRRRATPEPTQQIDAIARLGRSRRARGRIGRISAAPVHRCRNASASRISVVRLPRPYMLPADGADVFRNFVVPVPISETRCVRGARVSTREPGGPPREHHDRPHEDLSPVRRAGSRYRLRRADSSRCRIPGRPFPRVDAGPEADVSARRHVLAPRAGQRSSAADAPPIERQT